METLARRRKWPSDLFRGVLGAIGVTFLAGWKDWMSKSRHSSEDANTVVAADIMAYEANG